VWVIWYGEGVTETLPQHLRSCFWDVDATKVNPHQHRAFVLDRVLEYGTLTGVQWAEQFYGLESIREYFLARGSRVLSAKTRAFWQTVLGIADEPCTTTSSTQPNNPLWPY
jgi:hypothetical protein